MITALPTALFSLVSFSYKDAKERCKRKMHKKKNMREKGAPHGFGWLHVAWFLPSLVSLNYLMAAFSVNSLGLFNTLLNDRFWT